VFTVSSKYHSDRSIQLMQIVMGVTTLRPVKECVCIFEKCLVIVPAFLLTVIFPSIPLCPVNQHKVCAASEVYHAVNINNICVNRMARQLEGNIRKYVQCQKVNCDRSRAAWRALIYTTHFSGNSNNYFAVCSLS